MEYQENCLYFNGYKPCVYKRPCQNCPNFKEPSKRILIISLEALGAVLRTTCLLDPIKKKFPDCHITWLTLQNAKPLLDGNPLINKILCYSDKVLPVIDFLEFEICYVVDKSELAGALGQRVRAKEKLGFGINSFGSIVPFNDEAKYQYDVGLDDNLKFHINQKPETQQITETMNLPWTQSPYILQFSEQEKREIMDRKIIVQGTYKGVIGYSTGCSTLYPYKKFTVPMSIAVIQEWRKKYPNHVVALFGGKEDSERNCEIKAEFKTDPQVMLTPTDEGLRSGILWMATADLILTGCSLGLHISIALQKKIITWFGVSCSQEIDLYGLGIKLSSHVPCSPCWKKSCDQTVKCYDSVKVSEIMEATETLLSTT